MGIFGVNSNFLKLSIDSIIFFNVKIATLKSNSDFGGKIQISSILHDFSSFPEKFKVEF